MSIIPQVLDTVMQRARRHRWKHKLSDAAEVKFHPLYCPACLARLSNQYLGGEGAQHVQGCPSCLRMVSFVVVGGHLIGKPLTAAPGE